MDFPYPDCWAPLGERVVPKRRVRDRKAWNRGRSVAREAAVRPRPGSMAVQTTTSVQS